MPLFLSWEQNKWRNDLEYPERVTDSYCYSIKHQFELLDFRPTAVCVFISVFLSHRCCQLMWFSFLVLYSLTYTLTTHACPHPPRILATLLVGCWANRVNLLLVISAFMIFMVVYLIHFFSMPCAPKLDYFCVSFYIGIKYWKFTLIHFLLTPITPLLFQSIFLMFICTKPLVWRYEGNIDVNVNCKRDSWSLCFRIRKVWQKRKCGVKYGCLTISHSTVRFKRDKHTAQHLPVIHTTFYNTSVFESDWLRGITKYSRLTFCLQPFSIKSYGWIILNGNHGHATVLLLVWLLCN